MEFNTDAWRAKAHREIASMCRVSYLQANTSASGKLYKRKRPYTVPSLAQVLVECLKANDAQSAKAIFMRLAVIPESARD